MTVQDLVRVLRHGLLLIAELLLAGVAIALAVSQAQQPAYRSSESLLVTAAPQDSAASGQAANLLAQSRAQLLVTLATSDDVLNVARTQLDAPPSLDALAASVSASAGEGSNFTTVTASAATPSRAVDIASAVGSALRERGQSIDAARADPTAAIRITVATLPRFPVRPSSPDPLRAGFIGGAAGIAAAVLWLLLSDVLRARIRSAQDVVDLGLEIPVIPLRTSWSVKRHGEESVRHVREVLDASVPLGAVVLLFGVEAAHGVDALGRALHRAFSEAGASVDLRDGVADDALFLGRTDRGQASGLSGRSDVVREGARRNRAAGADAGVGQPRLTLVVAPPTSRSADAGPLAARSNATLLLVEAGRTRPADLGLSVERLRSVGARNLFCVLDGVRASEDAVVRLPVR